MHVLKPRNTKIGEPDIKKVGEKSQDNNEFIIHNNLINEGWNQTIDVIQEFEPPLQDS